MSDKRSNLSNDAKSRRRDSLTHDPNAQLFEEAMSRLRTVIVPGKEQLTLEERIAAAIQQDEAYRRWCESKKPLGDIKCWVKGTEIFSLNSPATLDHVRFRVPPDEKVVQLSTYVDHELIVLYNLRLEEVPLFEPAELEQTWPNGERICLTIVRKLSAVAAVGSRRVQEPKTQEFIITVARNPEEVKAQVKDQASTASQSDNKLRRNVDAQTAKRPFRSPLVSIANAIALLVLIVALTPLNQTTSAVSNNAVDNHQHSATNGDQVASNSEVTSSVPLPGKEFAGEQQSSSPGSVERSQSGSEVKRGPAKKRRVAIGWQLANLVSATLDAKAYSKPEDSTDKQAKVVQSDATKPDEQFVRQRQLELQRFAQLAPLSNVTVRLKGEPFEGIDDIESARSSFARAFETSPRFRLLKGADKSKADIVIGLHFERSNSNSWLVFVDVRGSDGRFIWRDFNECEKATGQDKWATFAAESLVSNLEEVISISQLQSDPNKAEF